ncbi:DUF3313 domain-containing protein [Paludibacterium yongneupense]|uniref:DUF3313 domain-containing protein n=1 Tax=Paludibacterium yongneupense TaxID=400061 RepID=UPI00040CFDC1|nr:DUF3313 domain-containing protein [Paludibacterium yongneupense]
MKTLFHFSCALVAWSLLSLTTAAHSGESILNLPKEAFLQMDGKPSQYGYKKPGVDLHSYSAIIIEPLAFIGKDSDGQWKLFSVDERNEVSRYYQQTLSHELQKLGITVTEQAGPGVLRLRTAVTSLSQEHQGFQASDLLPIKAVFNLARYAGGIEPYLVHIASMAQLEDANSGELLAGGVDLKKEGKQAKTATQAITFALMKPMLDRWCEQNAQLLAKTLRRQP